MGFGIGVRGRDRVMVRVRDRAWVRVWVRVRNGLGFWLGLGLD